MLEKDPDQRIVIQDIKNHNWVLQCGKDEIKNETTENNTFGNIDRLVKSRTKKFGSTYKQLIPGVEKTAEQREAKRESNERRL